MSARHVWNVERPLLNQVALSKGYKRAPFKNKTPPAHNVLGLLQVMHHVEIKKPKSGHRRAYAKKVANLANRPWSQIVHVSRQTRENKEERARKRRGVISSHYPDGIGAERARSWAAEPKAPRRSTRTRKAPAR